MPKLLNIACWLSLSRLLLLPVALLPVLLQWPGGWFMAAITSTVAGVTDALDGYLARKRNCATPLGAFLDPLTDKVFVLAMMLLLASHGAIPFWVPGIVAPREVVISLMRLHRFREELPISPDVWGKTKMVTSMVAIVGLLLGQDLHRGGVLAVISGYVPLGTILDLAWWVLLIAMALTLLSGVNYFFSYVGFTQGKQKAFLKT